MNHRLCIRTVFDARSRSTKHLYQLLLLSASWHKTVRKTAPMEVMIVGSAPDQLFEFLRKLDIQWLSVPADSNDSFSRTSNTIIGARDKAGYRILLVDNDVVFLGDLSELAQVAPDICMGAVAGSERVDSRRWQVIEDHFGVSLLPSTQVPLSEHVRHQINAKHTPRPLRNVYVNGGVILIPTGVNFETSWRRYVREIAQLFGNHPLRSECVYGSNMAALAMAITHHGNFQWLDLKYNYRPDCFALNMSSFPEIQIAHLTGVDDSHRSLGGRIDAFWKEKMVPRFSRANPGIAGHALENALTEANSLRTHLHALVDEYDLDQWAASLPRHTGHLLRSTWNRYINRPLYRLYGELLSSASRIRKRLAT